MYAKCGQKVLFRERAKSAYFRSANSDMDKMIFHIMTGYYVPIDTDTFSSK